MKIATTSRALLAFAVLLFSSQASAADEAKTEDIRLGWQTPWATQGQLVMALQHSNIAKLTGLDIKYAGFTYGAPLNQAAAAGQVDVLLTADQPAIALIANTGRFKIVARMMYNRVCLYVPGMSPLASVAELRGKTMMGPVGAAAERIALARLERAGIKQADVRLGNLDMAQQAALLKQAGKTDRWQGVDVLYGFDPFPAVFEKMGLAKMLNCENVTSVIVASSDMVSRRPEALGKFLKAFALAWVTYARHPSEMNRHFINVSRLDLDEDVLEVSAAVEPNRFAKTLTSLNLHLGSNDLASLSAARDFLLTRQVISTREDVAGYIDLGPLQEAMRGLRDTEIDRVELQGN